jgi:phage antirepressor YoqD-like protein
MTQAVAELIKEAGFKSVKEFAALIDVTPRTLNNWPRERIEEYLIYAKLKQEIQKNSEKAKIILAMLS